jgi:hypothetical protein
LQLNLAVWVENPAGSFFWDQLEWKALIESGRLSFFVTDFCRWGMPWRKRTKSSKPHMRLVGYSPLFRCAWTKAAEDYPSGLCNFLAKLLQSV